jgi:hypothetical protein
MPVVVTKEAQRMEEEVEEEEEATITAEQIRRHAQVGYLLRAEEWRQRVFWEFQEALRQGK